MNKIRINRLGYWSFVQTMLIVININTCIIQSVLKNSSFNYILAALIVVFLFMIGILFNIGKIPSKKIMMLIILILTYYSITFIIYHNTINVTIQSILIECILPLLVMDNASKSEKVLDYLMGYSFVILIFQNSIFVKNNITNFRYDMIAMSLSYALLPLFFAPIIKAKLYGKEKFKTLQIIEVLIIIYIFIKWLKYCYRGPFLAFVLGLVCIVLHQAKTGNIEVKDKIKKTIMSLTLIVGFYLIISNLEIILMFISRLLTERNINVAFINKSIYLLNSTNDITNGRLEVYTQAVLGFFHSPLYGNGISTFGIKCNIQNIFYPHNFILQILYDGGIVLGGAILVPILRSTLKIIGKCNDLNINTIYLLLIASTMMRSLLSFDLWEQPLLWMLIGLLLNYKQYRIPNQEVLKE